MTDHDTMHVPGVGPEDSCGCPDFSTSRRRFLQGAAALTGAGVLTAVHGSAFTQVAMAQVGVATNVLVVLSLRGGADGLSLVVPHGEPEYARLRKNIAIPTDTLLVKDEMFGLHPGFKPLEQMWVDGKFAAVQAVGLEAPNRSHFEAMELIEDSDPGSDARVGWLNRMIGLDTDPSPLQAVQMGSAIVPTVLYGPEPVLAVHRIDDMYLPSSDADYPRRRAALRETWRGVKGPLGRGSRSALKVSKSFEKLSEESTAPLNGATYVNGDLGKALAETARLLRDNLGAQVVTIDSGSWDMHTSMGNYDKGSLTTMLDELAGNLAAFFKDLGTLGDRVTVVTISEFGRRVEENANRGLDHGYAGVMLLAGAGVKGGEYYAPSWPGLQPEALEDGDLALGTDYRDVLSDVLAARFDTDVSKVFPGFNRTPVGCMT